MKNLIIIPTYNEEENIETLINTIFELINNHDIAILVVDDNSPDNTRNIVESLMKKYTNLFLLKRAKKMGLASAYIDGFKQGIQMGFDAFIEMDADFSHNPVYLSDMLEKLKTHDVVIGSRNIKNGSTKGRSFIRNLISEAGSIYARTILNCKINDLTGGFNGWRKEVLDTIGLDNIISKGYCFQIEMKYRAFLNNFNIIEFPIIFEDRKFGKSKMNKSIFIEAFFNVIKLKFICKKG